VTKKSSYNCLHFSLSNPRGPQRDDLPLLLRGMADEIESQRIRSEDVMDLILHQDLSGRGPDWSLTIYWKPQPN
jgi:hypothetical protein